MATCAVAQSIGLLCPTHGTHHEGPSNAEVCIVDALATKPFCVVQGLPEWFQALLNSFALLCLLRLVSSKLHVKIWSTDAEYANVVILMTSNS